MATTLTPQEISISNMFTTWFPSWSGIASSSYATAGTNGTLTLPSLPYATKCFVIVNGWYTTNTNGTGLNSQILIDGAGAGTIVFSAGGAQTASQPTPVVGSGITGSLSAGSTHTLTYQLANQGAGTFGGASSVVVIRMAV